MSTIYFLFRGVDGYGIAKADDKGVKLTRGMYPKYQSAAVALNDEALKANRQATWGTWPLEHTRQAGAYQEQLRAVKALPRACWITKL